VIEAIALVRQHWKLALIAGLVALVLVTRGQRDAARQALSTEKTERAADRDRADRQRTEQERGFALTIVDAVERQAARTAAREPIIVHSTNTVREYAQTDAGRALCLGADRVRGLDTYLAALTGADPAPAGSRAEAVRAGADPAPAGR
jgi:hypothetical protein